MQVASWYKGIFVTWLLLGIPSIALAVGFAGGNPFSGLDFSLLTSLDLALWIGGWTMLLAPIWLAPFGLRRGGQRKQRGG